MSTELLITIGIIIFTLFLSNMFGETKATKKVANEMKLIRQLLEKLTNNK